MSPISAYLFFDGTAAEAMRSYARALGGKLELMTQAEVPASAGMPPGDAARVMHANVAFDGGMLMASDTMSGQPCPPMSGFAVSLNYPDAARAQRVFEALSEGAAVTMPMSPTFWAGAFGMLKDRFGTPWMVGGGAPGTVAS